MLSGSIGDRRQVRGGGGLPASRFSYTQDIAFIGLGLPLISPSPLPTTQEIAFIGLGLPLISPSPLPTNRRLPSLGWAWMVRPLMPRSRHACAATGRWQLLRGHWRTRLWSGRVSRWVGDGVQGESWWVFLSVEVGRGRGECGGRRARDTLDEDPFVEWPSIEV